MCEPVSLATAASLAATAIGSTMQIQGQKKAQSAQQDVANAERIRQQGFQQRQQSEVDAAIPQVSRPQVETNMAAATGQREAALREASPTQTGYLPGQGNGPQVVRDEVDRRRAEVADYTGQQAAARAKIGGWADALYGVRTNVARTAQNVQTQGGFARGSLTPMQSEMSAAGYQGEGMRTGGDLAVLAGRAIPAASSAFGANKVGGWGGIFGGSKAATSSNPLG